MSYLFLVSNHCVTEMTPRFWNGNCAMWNCCCCCCPWKVLYVDINIYLSEFWRITLSFIIRQQTRPLLQTSLIWMTLIFWRRSSRCYLSFDNVFFANMYVHKYILAGMHLMTDQKYYLYTYVLSRFFGSSALLHIGQTIIFNHKLL